MPRKAAPKKLGRRVSDGRIRWQVFEVDGTHHDFKSTERGQRDALVRRLKKAGQYKSTWDTENNPLSDMFRF